MLKERIKRGTASHLVAQAARMAAQGAVVVLLARVFLGPDEYGLLFLAMSVLSVALLVANLGIAKSGARYLAEYLENDPAQVPHIARRTVSFNLVSIVVTGVLLVAFADEIAALIGEPALAPLLVVGSAYVAFRSLQTFFRLSFQGLNRVTLSAAVGIASNVALPVFVVVALLAGADILGVLVGYVLSAAVAVLVGTWLLYTRYYVPYREDVPMEEGLSRRILEYSLPLTATRGANVLDKQVDTILVGFFLNPAAVGFYTLGKQMSEFVAAPARSLGFTISPAYGKLKAADEIDRAARIYEIAFEHIVLVYVPAVVGLILVAEPAVRYVFGPEYLPAVPVIQILAITILLQGINNITNDGLDYLGRATARAIAKGTASVTNFVLNLLLIPRFGVVGAAAATVFTHSALVIVDFYLIHQEFSLSLSRLGYSLGGICLISAGMAVPILFLRPTISGILSLVGVVLLGVVIWAALSVLSGFLDVDQVKTLVS